MKKWIALIGIVGLSSAFISTVAPELETASRVGFAMVMMLLIRDTSIVTKIRKEMVK